MFEVIGFDADDTLWENEIRYQEAKLRTIDLLSKYQPADDIGARLDEIEISNLPFYGYGIKSFGLSLVEAAVSLSGEQLDTRVLLSLLDLIKEMLQAEILPTANAEETLAELADRYPLMLITKGDLFEQERKIYSSRLAGYFQYIEVVSEKTESGYRQALGKYGINPARFLMVGNSLKSDILPVLNLGGQAVYIPHDQTWHHEIINENELGGLNYGQVERLNDLPGYLRNFDG